MGKKRKFNRFIKWIKSDLPEEKSSVLLLGVTKLASPSFQRRVSNTHNRPHTLHFEFPVTSGPGDTNYHNYRNSYNQELNSPSGSSHNSDVLSEYSPNVLSTNRHTPPPSHSPPPAPPLPVKTTKSASFSSTKENESPPYNTIESPKFADKSIESKLKRQSSLKHNSEPRKRVSFSKETEEIINAREIARRNRDLSVAETTPNPLVTQCCCGESLPVSDRFVELPIGYCNYYVRECVDEETEDAGLNCDCCDYGVYVDAKPDFKSQLTVKSNSSEDDVGDILDQISDDLNIRPISRQNSLAFSDDSSQSSASLTTKLPTSNRKLSTPITPVNNTDIGAFLDALSSDFEQTPFKSTTPRCSVDSTVTGYAAKRKLSIPITPVQNGDVDVFLSEIIAELDIGPHPAPPRSRSQSKSERTAARNSVDSATGIPRNRKLSIPITPVRNDDVDVFLNEIIDELDIGPRSRSQSKSEKGRSASLDSASSAVLLLRDVQTKLSNIDESVSLESSSCSPFSSQPCLAATPKPDSHVSALIQNLAEITAMDRSVDSIGSCSLDVDLSTDFSDSSRGSISGCTLRSVSIITPNSNGQINQPVIVPLVPPPVTTKQPALDAIPRNSYTSSSPVPNLQPVNSELSEPLIKITDTDSSSSKKPSYLNLACCVNGYSNLTTYDSKLRETYRSGTSKSREVSPNRPLSTDNYNASYHPPTKGEHNLFLTPELANRRQLSPKIIPPRMAEGESYVSVHKSPNGTELSSFTSLTQNGASQGYYTSSKSFISTESRNFAASMLYNNCADVTDGYKARDNHHRFASSASSTFTSANVISTVYASATQISKDGTNSSSSLINSTGGARQSSSDISISDNCSQSSSSKSFIQQRVERLYGPGALAQGFFISTKRQKRSENGGLAFKDTESEIFPRSPLKDIELDLKGSSSSPSLPVLRHLRPEFRAQLPILSPKRFATENGIQKTTTIPITLLDDEPLKKNISEEMLGTVELQRVETVSTEDIMELKESKAVENLVCSNNNKNDLFSEQESESKKNLLLTSQISVESLAEHLPAAPQVILPVAVVSVTAPPTCAVDSNGEQSLDMKLGDVKIIESQSIEKDGHYFLEILRKETARLIGLAEKVEEELELKKAELSDDVLGYLRSASGKARLLATQKMQQFEGLCHKNLSQVTGEPFPTTAEDLQGFWDMVMLQVTQVNELFRDLDKLRANNWIEVKEVKRAEPTKSRTKLVRPPSTQTANSEAQRIKREAQRKLMLEQRRKAMAARASAPEETSVEIFAPDPSS